jgi:hypothetical protein
MLLVVMMLELGMGLLVLMLWSNKLRWGWQVRVELGVGCWGGKVVGVELAWYSLVQHNDVALFKVLDEGMQVLEVETTAGVIAAELVFAFHGRERVHDGTSV